MEEIRVHIETDHATRFSDVVKNIIYGGVDGVITTFSIIAASYAADMDMKMILVIAFSNVLADGFSMGFGDYLSSMSEKELVVSERRKEELEYDMHKAHEVRELVEFYTHKGLEEEDAFALVSILGKDKYKEAFLDHMMMYELGMSEPDETKDIVKKGVITMVSFCAFGCVPLSAFVVARLFSVRDRRTVFMYSCLLCAMTLFSVGSMGAYVSRRPLLKAGATTLVNGSIASCLAYFIGWFLHKALT